MKKVAMFVSICLTFLFVGCAGKSDFMQPIALTKADTALSQDESAIVFFRPSGFGFAISAPIAEFADNDLKFVTIVSAKSKVFYKTTVGKHSFVVGGETGDLLEADLEGGKTYYALISPRMGMIQANFAFEPITDKELNSQEFLNNLDECAWHTNKPESQSWFIENKESMQTKYQNALRRAQNSNNQENSYGNVALDEMKKQTQEGKKVIKPEYGI